MSKKQPVPKKVSRATPVQTAVLSMFDKGSKSGESALSRNLTVFKEEKKMRYGVYEGKVFFCRVDLVDL